MNGKGFVMCDGRRYEIRSVRLKDGAVSFVATNRDGGPFVVTNAPITVFDEDGKGCFQGGAINFICNEQQEAVLRFSVSLDVIWDSPGLHRSDQSRGQVDRLLADIDSMRDKVREHDRLKESNRDLCLVLAETRAEVIRLVERLIYAEKARDSAFRANGAMRNDVTLLAAQRRYRKAEIQIRQVQWVCVAAETFAVENGARLTEAVVRTSDVRAAIADVDEE